MAVAPPRKFRQGKDQLWDVGHQFSQKTATTAEVEDVAGVDDPPASPPTMHSVEGWQGLLHFLETGPFQTSYWERWPVLLRAGSIPPVLDIQGPVDSGSGDGAALLEQLLSDPTGYSTAVDGFDEGSVRTLTYINGSFNNTLPPRPHRQREPELRSALSEGLTLQMGRAQNWIPQVAALALDILDVTGRPPNVNVYVTPAGKAAAMAVHNDFQCSMMVQLVGRKRWRLWLDANADNLTATTAHHSECAEGWTGNDCMVCADGFTCGEWPSATRVAPSTPPTSDAHLSLPVRNAHIRGRNGGAEASSLQPNNLPAPYMDVVLVPGDVLYVPRGCLHWTATDTDDTGAFPYNP